MGRAFTYDYEVPHNGPLPASRPNHFPIVVYVDFNFTSATDAALEPLTELTQLQRLWLDKTRITDAGLDRVKGLAQLRELSFLWTKITDVGLEHLKGLAPTALLGLRLHFRHRCGFGMS